MFGFVFRPKIFPLFFIVIFCWGREVQLSQATSQIHVSRLASCTFLGNESEASVQMQRNLSFSSSMKLLHWAASIPIQHLRGDLTAMHKASTRLNIGPATNNPISTKPKSEFHFQYDIEASNPFA